MEKAMSRLAASEISDERMIAMCRTALGDPEILILDEATSSLDLETERKVQRSLDELRAGRTTIIIAH